MLNNGNVTGRVTADGSLTGSVSNIKNVSGGIDKPGKVYEKDYENLDNLPSKDGVTIIGDKSNEDLRISTTKTTAEWEALVDLVPVSGEICVYSDGAEDASGDPVPTFKFGDGETLLSDLPFVSATDLGIYEWARQPEKPTYTYDEVGAVGAENELHITEIDRMFQTVFG